ncbi:hypothetical protein ACFL0V_04505 [Nanoarchaeota archaeon]
MEELALQVISSIGEVQVLQYLQNRAERYVGVVMDQAVLAVGIGRTGAAKLMAHAVADLGRSIDELADHYVELGFLTDVEDDSRRYHTLALTLKHDVRVKRQVDFGTLSFGVLSDNVQGSMSMNIKQVRDEEEYRHDTLYFEEFRGEFLGR